MKRKNMTFKTSKEKDNRKSLDITTGVVNENIPTPNLNEVLHEIEDLVNTCQSQMSGAEIIVIEILPRFQQNENWRYIYEREVNLIID